MDYKISAKHIAPHTPIEGSCGYSSRYTGELILDVMARFVATAPEKLSLLHLDSNAEIAKSFTHAQLWNYSGALALKLLMKYKVTQGDRVMIVYPPGIDYAVAFLACLRLGAVVVSVYPPNPEKLKTDIPKFAHYVTDSSSSIALTTVKYKKVVKLSKTLGAKWPDNLTWIPTDSYDLITYDMDAMQDSSVHIDQRRNATDLAFIQYTSGSTGDPKGVVITHGNVSHQASSSIKSFELTNEGAVATDAIYVGWVPQYHDLGLFQGCLTPWLGGYTAYNISPIDFLRNPTIWPIAMERYKASLTFGPSFAYNLACKRTKAAGLQINLSEVRAFVNGGEPLDPETATIVRECWNTVEGNFYNGYGQAETTLAVAIWGTKKHNNHISVGNINVSLSFGHDIRVVNWVEDCWREAEDGEEGEIWTHSPSVAHGYWNKSELTRQVFKAMIAEVPNKHFQRSGDLGYVKDGELYITSRLKDLIIINGKNYAPTDVERCAEHNFTVIRPGSSIAIQPVSAPHAVLICEIREKELQNIVYERLAKDIRAQIVADVEVPIGDVILVKARTVPKTTSGKVQRKECHRMWSEGRLDMLYSLQTNNGQHAECDLRFTEAESLFDILTLAGVEHWDETLAANGIDSLLLSQIVNSAQQIGLCIPYQDAMSMSAKALLREYSDPRDDDLRPSIRLPGFTDTTQKRYYDTPGFSHSLLILLRQLLVLSVIVSTILLATIPSAALTNELWQNASTPQWVWQINGRLGPISVVAVTLWIITYTVLCVVLKWVLIGRQPAGPSAGRRMWSNAYMRWMMVQGVFNVWEHTGGRFLIDTPLLNLFYTLLGAHIHPTARVQTFFRDWDLITIKRDSTIKGLLCPHYFTPDGVVFNSIHIGQSCTLGAHSVAQSPLTLHDNCEVRACSYLNPFVELHSGVYEGNPVQRRQPMPDDVEVSSTHEYTPWHATRLLLPVLIFALCTLSAAGVSWLLPDVTVYLRSPVWSQEYLLVVLSYLATYQLVGVCVLLASLLLKWTFISPYLTDTFASVAFHGFFVYLSKTFAINYWHRLFGMSIGPDSILVSPGICSASTAHRVAVGTGCFLVNCTLNPSQGPTVWSYLYGTTASPWWSSDAQHRDIRVGDYSQILLRARLEAGVCVGRSVIVAALTRVPANTTVRAGTTAIGNPYTNYSESVADGICPELVRPEVSGVSAEMQYPVAEHIHKQPGDAGIHKQSGDSEINKQASNAELHKQSIHLDIHKQTGDAGIHKLSVDSEIHRQSSFSEIHKQPSNLEGAIVKSVVGAVRDVSVTVDAVGKKNEKAEVNRTDLHAHNVMSDVTDKQAMRFSKRQLVLHTVLVFSTVFILSACVAVLILGLASLPIYTWHYIPRVAMAVLYGLASLCATLWALVWVAKWVLIGRQAEGEFTMRKGTRSVVFLYLQGLHCITADQVLALFSGTFLVNLYIYSMGADVSLLYTQTFTDNIEPADAHHLTLRAGAILDHCSYASCHRAAKGSITLRHTSIMKGGVLHPAAGILLGSVGCGTQLMPGTMPLREMHMAEDEVWCGAPAIRAKLNVLDEAASATEGEV